MKKSNMFWTGMWCIGPHCGVCWFVLLFFAVLWCVSVCGVCLFCCGVVWFVIMCFAVMWCFSVCCVCSLCCDVFWFALLFFAVLWCCPACCHCSFCGVVVLVRYYVVRRAVVFFVLLCIFVLLWCCLVCYSQKSQGYYNLLIARKFALTILPTSSLRR